MKSFRRSGVQRLRRDRLHHFKERGGLCLRAERGWLWITVEGELDDIQLGPGQSRTFVGGADVVVGAPCGDAVYSVTPVAQRPGWAQRLWAWIAPLPSRSRA